MVKQAQLVYSTEVTARYTQTRKKNKEDYRKASFVILRRQSLISNLTGSQRNLNWVFSLELRTFATYKPASLLKVDSLSFTIQL